MAQWRIRVAVPDGPGGHQVLRSALARIPATELQVAPHSAGLAEPAGDIVVELGEEESLGDLLRTLHEISPQVFISRVNSAEPAAAGRRVRVRKLRRAVSLTG